MDEFIQATFPFIQRLGYKFYFIFDPGDGLISQFVDIEEEQKDFYREIEVARSSFSCHKRTRHPTNSLKIPLCLRAESNSDCWISKQTLSLLASRSRRYCPFVVSLFISIIIFALKLLTGCILCIKIYLIQL